jgi:hypothetical protein
MKKIAAAIALTLALPIVGCDKPVEPGVSQGKGLTMAIYDSVEGVTNGGPAAKTVWRYHTLMQQIKDKARTPEYSRDDWKALAEVVDTSDFQRFGNFLEVQNWDQYIEMLDSWAPRSEKFSTTFRRMTEHGNLVFVELQESHDTGNINSVSIYELNSAGKIFRLHIYLQAPRST